jgi:hypothetical protein
MTRTRISKLLYTIAISCFAFQLQGAPIYTLRFFNTDDVMSGFITNSSYTSQPILTGIFNTDTGNVDISSYVTAGSNTIYMQLLNDHSGWTYGYQFKIDGAIQAQDVCGVVTLTGCIFGDFTIGPAVFTQSIVFQGPGTTVATPEPSSMLLGGLGILALGWYRRREVLRIIKGQAGARQTLSLP